MRRMGKSNPTPGIKTMCTLSTLDLGEVGDVRP